MDERNFAQEMMNLNSNEAKLGSQFMGNLGGMQINAVKKWYQFNFYLLLF